MHLHSCNKYDEIGEFDPATGSLQTYSGVPRTKQAQGFFAHLGGEPLVLYRDSGRLWLYHAGSSVSFAAANVQYARKGIKRELRYQLADGVHRVVAYTMPELDPPLEFDPTPFVEEEDFDFGLFLFNVSRDVDRQNRLFRNEAERRG